MNNRLKGIALILFGILLVLFSMTNPWIPIVGSIFKTIVLWGGLISGIIGTVIAFKNNDNK